MLETIIVQITNFPKEIKEEIPTTCESRQSQPLLDNEYLHEKLVDDEKKKGHKECDDGY
jgi:hypothetical protein